MGSHSPGARHGAPSVASSGEEFSLHLACCTSFGFWSPHPPACWRKVWRVFSPTSSLPTPSVRLWTVSLTFCYVLLGQTLGPLSPLPSPPMVPSQFRCYKAYDGRSKSQPKPVAVNKFQETDWNSGGHWRRVTLQLSFATEPRGPGSSDTEARIHPKSKVSTQNAWESSHPQFPYKVK